jgi:glycosyltransferase involved in cell wall biosynthesis
MSQTIGLEHLEVIAVNDASTDRTLEKLYQWERRFPENIMVITYEKNIRQGGARNIGLQYASGEYIGFVDADDWIDSAMYQKLFIFRRKLPMKIIIGKVF